MKKWWHLYILRHFVIEWIQDTSIEDGEIFVVNTCSCGKEF